MSSSLKPLRWGILATGGIAETFAKDLLRDPSTRGVSDVNHVVQAAASSTSADRAKAFLKEVGAPSSAKAYGSYKELVSDPDVDIIYVATPHSHHYQNTRLCLEAGKNVLLEKSFTTNAEQAKVLVDLARQKGLFLMEAQWTRYFPLAINIRKLAAEGTLGDIKRMYADNAFGDDVEKKFDVKHRMVNPDLAGGALLDLGIYSILWIFQLLYHIQPKDKRVKPKVSSIITPEPRTGADECTTIIMQFATGAHGIATTGLRVGSDPDGKHSAGPSIKIQGTKGELQIFPPAYRPTQYRIIPNVAQNSTLEYKEVTEDIPGHGMFWEADECYRCIRDGKKESDTIPLEETLVMMEVMDEVRKQNGLVYPEAIETTDYPRDL
ncbi:NAD(P)-binding protein [Rhizodiscina lignyota]|uniref:D-xylose 1-dehydrogenase (NADP(+), D-xylono-1,5-lactone-forming) n=1 Tax=Rhizodiscina lignyota TaxID=1504668 RepID=A0A9P4M4D7_9PEZI|nr:NAD(P)-binding protein [Rhizodiscina lignyota]